jgi:hypothetical protein
MDGVDDVLLLIEYIACSLVDEPEAVKVNPICEQGGIVYRLTVAPQDVGKIIGKHGRTVQCIRVILAAAGMKLKRKHSLDIVAQEEFSSDRGLGSLKRSSLAMGCGLNIASCSSEDHLP